MIHLHRGVTAGDAPLGDGLALPAYLGTPPSPALPPLSRRACRGKRGSPRMRFPVSCTRQPPTRPARTALGALWTAEGTGVTALSSEAELP